MIATAHVIRFTGSISFLMPLMLLAGCQQQIGNFLNSSRHPLHVAAMNGDLARVLALIKQGEDVNKTDYSGGAPIHYAALHGHKAVVEALVSHGASVDRHTTREDATPLMFAVFGRHSEIVEVLLKAKSDVNYSAQHGLTALHFACGQPLDSMTGVQATAADPHIVQMLLDAGADPNAKDKTGSTSLHHAALYGETKVVELLIAKNANPTIKTQAGGLTALDPAVKKGHTSTASVLREAVVKTKQ